MRITNEDVETILEAVESWETADDQLERILVAERIVDQTARRAPGPGLAMELRKSVAAAKEKAIEERRSRQKRGVILRAKLLQMQEEQPVNSAGPEIPNIRIGSMVCRFEQAHHWRDCAAEVFRARGATPCNTVCIDSKGRVFGIQSTDFPSPVTEDQMPVNVYWADPEK